METLPQDIMFDVLSKLPARSIVRFRRVCKSWCCLISKPEFVKTHLNRAITEDVSVGCRRLLIPNIQLKSDTMSFESIDYEALQLLSEQKLKAALKNKGGKYACTVLDYPNNYPEHRVKLVGYCHGMVGLVVNEDKIVICNPCTREFRELPKPTCTNFKYTIHGGLGYDSSVDYYKFVKIAVNVKDDDDRDRGIKAEIFSLRSNSWRMLHDSGGDISCFGVDGSGGVFLNGALHWIARCESTGQIIISFDMATEKFQELYFPIPGYDYPQFKDLIILGGCLSVSGSFTGRDIEVWIMKEYGAVSSWTKLFTLDLRFNMDYVHCLRPLCFSKNGELLVVVDCQIRIYNPKEQNSRKLYQGNWYCQNLIVYIESLVSPNGNGGKKSSSTTRSNSHELLMRPKLFTLSK